MIRLSAGLELGKKVTLVLGAPGSGKTLLATHYARTAGPQVFWFSLTELDCDPVGCGKDLIEGLRDRFGFISNIPSQTLSLEGRRGLGTAMSLLCEELAAGLDGPLILVIDDCHQLQDSADESAGIGSLVRFFPDHSQLLLVGRTPPPGRLARYEAGGQAVAIRGDELLFTPAEVQAYLSSGMRKRPTPEVGTRVFEQTRGWPIAVRSVSLGGDPVHAIERPECLFRYLAEEVLPAFPTEFRGDLARAALLPRLDVRACQELAGERGEALFIWLCDQAPFVLRRDDELELHPIFREFLLHEFRSELSRDATIRRLLDRFEPDRRQASPWLDYVEGSVLNSEGRLEEAIATLQTAESRAAASGLDAPLGYIWTALAYAYTILGDAELQLRYASQGLGALPADASGPRASCLNSHGLAQLHGRDIDGAMADFEQARIRFAGSGDAVGEIHSLHNLGYAASQRGEHSRAIHFYRLSLGRAKTGNVAPLPLTFANLALSQLALGLAEECWEAVTEGMALEERVGGTARNRSYLLWSAGQLWFEQGDYPRARESFEAAHGSARQASDRHAMVQAHLALANVAMQEADLEEAERQIGLAVGAAGVGIQDPGLVAAATLRADLDLRRGDHDRCRALLDHVTTALEGAADPRLVWMHDCPNCWRVIPKSRNSCASNRSAIPERNLLSRGLVHSGEGEEGARRRPPQGKEFQPCASDRESSDSLSP